MRPFHLDGPDATPLAHGPLLLEASAGTGKTYTIAGVVVRLVLEHDLALDRIAVMTFTTAATAELRDRIRATLALTDAALASDDAATGFPGWLRQCQRRLPAAQQALWRQRLRRALAMVDAAPITTIHAFARRVAVEQAAAVGIDPAATVTVDLDAWRDQTVRDWFRLNLQPADAAVAGLLGRDPIAELTAVAKGIEQHPLALVATPALSPADCRERCETARGWWQAHRPQLVAHAERHLAGLKRNDIFHPVKLPDRLELCDMLFAGHIIAGDKARKLADWWDDDKLGKIAVPGFDRSLFTAIPDHLPDREVLAGGLRAAFTGHYQRMLAQRPRTARELHVGDALLALDGALHGADGEALAARIGGRYDAVLVDEFQDTDLLQWRILERCFADDRHRLVLIGDPKQAIYAFRGADVHAYAAACAALPAACRHTLGTNHRSDRPLVEALNTLYLGDGRLPPLADAFAIPEVAYHRIAAVHEARIDPGRLETEAVQILALDAESAGNMGDATAAACAAVTAEIVRLLDPANGVRLHRGDPAQGATVAPRDIAVLVRNHRQADDLHAALAAARIPAVRQDRSSVFASEAAMELQAFLAGCLDPLREDRARTAAATRYLGIPAAGLAAEPPPAALTTLSLTLATLGEVLRRQGIAAWWYRACDTDGGWGTPRLRLAALGDGGRFAMDTLHLVELMAAEPALAPGTMADWLAQQRLRDEVGEDRQRRLERDDDAVRILTLHVSKGLQFPIVFEACAWNGARDPRPPVLIHPDGGATAVCHLGALDAATECQARREALGDDLRKLYVGLTRAMHRLYVVWAPVPNHGRNRNGSTTSALAWLLCGRGGGRDLGGDPFAAVQAGAAEGLDIPVHPAIRLRTIATAVVPTAAVPSAVPDAVQPTRAVLPATGIIRSWTRCSFTGLAQRAEAAADQDHDQDTPHAPRADDEAPGGAALGTLVHHLYQHADLAAWQRDPALVASALGDQAATAGLDLTPAQTTKLASAMRRAVIQRVPGAGAVIAELPASALAREWPVRLRLARPSPSLDRVFAGHVPQAPAWPAALAGIRLPAGVFTGVLDALLCIDGRYHVVDWKTNLLDAYDGPALDAVMADHHYLLQAHLYLLAVHRFLRWRLPDYDPGRHLGVAAYAFVRGLREDSDDGWAVVHPDPHILEALDACCD